MVCKNEVPHTQFQVFRLKNVSSPEECICPLNTLGFVIVDVDSEEELSNYLLTAMLGPTQETFQMPYFEGSTIYMIGRKVTIDGREFIENSRCGTFIEFFDGLDEGITILPE